MNFNQKTSCLALQRHRKTHFSLYLLSNLSAEDRNTGDERLCVSVTKNPDRSYGARGGAMRARSKALKLWRICWWMSRSFPSVLLTRLQGASALKSQAIHTRVGDISFLSRCHDLLDRQLVSAHAWVCLSPHGSHTLVHETMGRKTNQRRSDRWTEGQASRQAEGQTVTFTRSWKGKFNLGEQRWRCVSSSIRLSAGERTAVFSCHPLTHAPLNRTEYFFFLIHTPGVLACKLLQMKIIHPTHPQPPPPPSCNHRGYRYRNTGRLRKITNHSLVTSLVYPTFTYWSRLKPLTVTERPKDRRSDEYTET